MADYLYILSLSFLFGTILLVFGMRYLSAVLQARARHGGEAYRQLAEGAAAAQADTAAALAAIQTALADVRTRLAGVEKILKDVE